MMHPRLAQIVSWIFHPLLVPLYGVYIIFHYNTYLAYTIPDALQVRIYLIVALNTLLLPGLTSFFLLRRGLIRSLEMKSSVERKIPFLATAVFFVTGYFMLRMLELPRLFNLLILGAAVSVVIALIINVMQWKISVHLIGIGGIVGAIAGMSKLLIVDLRLPLVITILLAGLVGTARLSLRAHTPAQVYAGFLTGFLVEYLLLIL